MCLRVYSSKYGDGQITTIKQISENKHRIDVDFQGTNSSFLLEIAIAKGSIIFFDPYINGLEIKDKLIVLKHILKTKHNHNTNQFFSKDELNLYLMLKNKYKFEGFIHCTRFENLIEIVKEDKLLCRNKAHNFVDIANDDVIEHTKSNPFPTFDYVRFYFYKNTPTYYRFNEKIVENSFLIYLIFDWNIIHIDGVRISNGNMASNNTVHWKFKDYVNNYNLIDWDTVFSRGSIDPINSFETIRIRNAELLVPTEVSLNYLNKIIFKCKDDLNKFIKCYTSYFCIDDISSKCVVDSSYFI